jgi:hypothetical protein
MHEVLSSSQKNYSRLEVHLGGFMANYAYQVLVHQEYEAKSRNLQQEHDKKKLIIAVL